MRNATKLALAAALSLSTLLNGCKRMHRAAHNTINHTLGSAPDYTPQLQAILTAGHLPDLKYPDFTDIQLALQNLYDTHDFDPVWLDDKAKPTPQANAMLQEFSNATKRGLRPEDYDASKWQDRVANLKSPEGAALFDIALSVNAARFLSDLHQGRTNPAHFTFGVKGYDDKHLDTVSLLDTQFLNASDIPSSLDAMEPQAAEYKALKAGLAHYIELAAQDHADQLPVIDTKAKTIPLTADYPAMAALKQRLALVGDLQIDPATADLDSTTEALKHFQQRHGILPDGKLGHDVIEALNIPITARVTQIADTMERWRWLSDDYQNAAIMVNLPEFELRAYEGAGADHHEVFRMEVVDGKSDDETHHTPVIADQMKYLIFRPFWNVPPSIAKKEIIPHMEHTPGYLGAKGYETVDLKGNPAEADMHRIEQGSVMVRQKSGTSNSLGLVKFMFPNPFNVYLHDTNEKALFARNRRDYSHGCVRVQDPPKLADWVLRDNPKWDPDSIADAMNNGDDNKSVPLAHPIPVVIFYGTAWSDNGDMHFFKDMYGYDEDLEKTLDHGRPYPQKPMKEVTEKDA